MSQTSMTKAVQIRPSTVYFTEMPTMVLNVRWTSSEMAVDSSQSSNVQPLPRYCNKPKIKSLSGDDFSQLHHNPSTKETSQLPLHLDKRCGMIHKAYGIGGKISLEISCNQRWDKKHTRGTNENQSQTSLLNPHLLFAGLGVETTNDVSLMEEPGRHRYRDPTHHGH
jgi:hypothetical protein